MKSNLQIKIGIALMIICAIVYSAALVIPFLNIRTSVKLALVPVGIVTGEIAFWGGAFFLGKELVKKYKSHLNPLRWFGKGGKKTKRFSGSEDRLPDRS
jgi:hypothetical protein